MRRSVVLLCCLLVGASWIGYRCISLNDDEIRAEKWKFNDTGPEFGPFHDFIYFGKNACTLRADTVWLQDTAIATVDCAYLWFGRSKLLLRSIPEDRTIEYVDY